MSTDPLDNSKSRKNMPESIQQEYEKLVKIVEKYFPGKFRFLEACLSVKAIELINGITLPFCLILIAKPGSGKSTILYIVESLGNCYSTDNFTSKSFVSHIANVEKSKLKEIDLLPKIQNKTFITPELAPLFTSREDNLMETIGVLTKVLDGKGYKSESGVHGQRGYDEDIFFTWIGAIVEIKAKIWKMIGFMGPKMYFLRMTSETDSAECKRGKILEHMKDKSYDEKLQQVKDQIGSFWEIVKIFPNQKDNKIIWDESKDDPDVLERIVIVAQVLAKLRAFLPTKDTAGTSGSNYGYEEPIEEDPERAAHQMYNLAKGHAVLFGRNFIIMDDLRVVLDVALSSASRDRVMLFELLLKFEELSTSQIMDELKTTNDTALKKMKEFELLGLVDRTMIPGTTKPESVINLKKDYHWFLSDEFKSL
jgi:hypothetical protein